MARNKKRLLALATFNLIIVFGSVWYTALYSEENGFAAFIWIYTAPISLLTLIYGSIIVARAYKSPSFIKEFTRVLGWWAVYVLTFVFAFLGIWFTNK